MDLAEDLRDAVEIDARQLAQRTTARLQVVAGSIEEARPESGQQTRAAVAGGTPAEADDDVAHAEADRRGKHLAGAEGRGGQRVAFGERHARQAGCRGHLDDRVIATAQECGTQRSAQRIARVNGQLEPLVAGGLDRLEGSLAAIGQRDQVNVVAWPRAQPAIAQRACHGQRIERALERIGRDEDAHSRLAWRPLPVARRIRGCGSSAGAPGRRARGPRATAGWGRSAAA